MDGVRDIGWTELPCNFVQIMENAVDPHHTEWLHGRFFEFMGPVGRPCWTSQALRSWPCRRKIADNRTLVANPAKPRGVRLGADASCSAMAAMRASGLSTLIVATGVPARRAHHKV